MPELPEVETIARALRPKLTDKTILDVKVRWARTVASPSVGRFRELIKGRMITDVTRRAKYLIIQLRPVQESHSVTYSLMIHLRMSGDLLVREDKIKPEKHDRLILTLSADKNAAVPQGCSARDGG